MNRQWRRRARLPEIVILLAFGFTALSSTAAAQAQVSNPQQSSGLVSLDVVDADLAMVVLTLARGSEQNIIITDREKTRGKVTATLKNVPLETALKYVVESVGCSWRRQPDGVYIIGGNPPAQPASAPAPDVAPETGLPLLEGGSSYSKATGGFYEARRESQVDTVKLYNTGPVDMMWLLGLYEYKDAGKIQDAPVKPGVYIQQENGALQTLIGPPQGTPPLTEPFKTNPAYAERAPDVTGEASQYAPPTPPGYGGQRPMQQPGRPGQPTIPGAPGAPGAPGQPGAPTGLLPQGIDFIMPYEQDNSLIVRGDEEGIEELKSIISKLDVAPKQIMIKAEFVSISTDEVEALGINWTLERLNTSFQTQFSQKGNVVVGYANGNLMATLKAQLSKSKGKLVNAPIISTLNNVPAVISIGKIVPYTSSQTVFNPQGTPTTSSITQFLPIQSMLTVVPRVNNADQSITCFIQPMISDSEKTVETPSGDVPIVNQQQLQTTRRVGNGETIVLGGIIRKQDNTSVDKIPFLGDLPIIGPLFRTTSTESHDTELLIFLTPTIVPERPIGGAGLGVVP